MTIYGVAILAACYLIGQWIGAELGALLGIDANVGGVGFSMLLLMLANSYMHRRKLLAPMTEGGILFWSNLYIPVIVAMSAVQNVAAALSGGAVAIIAGILVTIIPMVLLPFVVRLMKRKAP
ncbi:MAG TPA: malonate transporter subunit MadL [Cyclobacteriaceae bacterium]|nr:malonate transporter subunit MadL [Cyclobacteriaceae bacterium]